MAEISNPPAKTEDKPVKEEKEQKKKYVEKAPRAEGDKKEEKAEGKADAKAEEGADKAEKGEKEKRPKRERPEGEAKEKKNYPERERRPKRQRKELEEYDFDPSKITEDTKIAKLPKKNEQKQKPEEKVFKQREEEINHKIEVLKEKRAKVLSEKFERDKKAVAKQGGEKNIFDQFEVEKEEVIKIREEFHTLMDKINDKKHRIDEAKNELKAIDDEIKSIDKSRKGDTKENIFDRVRRLEHQLLTDSLSPKQQRELHVEIQTLKRLIGSAESSENLEVELAKLKERREEKQQEVEILYAEKKVFNDVYQPLHDRLDKQNALVNKLKQECIAHKGEQKQFRDDVDKERNAFYDKKTERKDAIDAEISKLRDSKDLLWDEYHLKFQEYLVEQNLIRWIEWQMRQKERIVKKKEYQERQKKRAEREKEDAGKEEVKTRAFDAEIKNCEFLIDYCLRLVGKNQKQEEDNKPVLPEMSKADIEARLLEDKAWGKEKGLTVMETKKTRDVDEEPASKKNKKQKKQPQEKASDKKASYEHGLPIMIAFNFVKILVPLNEDDVDKVVNELKEKHAYFLKQSAEEKAASPEKPKREESVSEVNKDKVKEELPKEEVAPIS